MNATNGTNGAAVLDRVRAALAEAQATGRPAPGRPTLARLTGGSDYQVRKALAALETSPAVTSSPAPGAASPPATAGDPGDSPVATRSPARQSHASSPASRQAASELATENASQSPAHHHQPPPTTASDAGESPARQPTSRRQPRVWPLLVIGLAAAVAVWSGWVGLGQLAGFGVIQPLPGVWDDLRLNTAIVLPISVEAYAAYALRIWLSTETSARTTRFARFSTIASLVVGAGAQVAFHLMAAAGYTRAPWPVVTLVATVPVVVLGLASALAKLVANDAKAKSTGSPGETR